MSDPDGVEAEDGRHHSMHSLVAETVPVLAGERGAGLGFRERDLLGTGLGSVVALWSVNQPKRISNNGFGRVRPLISAVVQDVYKPDLAGSTAGGMAGVEHAQP